MTRTPPDGSHFHLRLPATSANLGPGFDTVAVALDLHLEIAARPADTFSILAQGRNADACRDLDGNLILETYRRILLDQARAIQPLHLDVCNEIPLGMGCGSSAAARLAGIVLAVEFGGLGWANKEILAAATHLEGHPDNAAACWLGGMTVATVRRERRGCDAGRGTWFPPVTAARIAVPPRWKAVLVLPRVPMQTEESRKVLPDQYDRADVIENIQHCALLVAAFASGQDEMLRAAMHDTLHQPYRSAFCPLLEKLFSLPTEEPSVLGIALSGAGPGVLLIVTNDLDEGALRRRIARMLGSAMEAEVLVCGFLDRGAQRRPGATP